MPDESSGRTPEDELLELVTGSWKAQAVEAFAELGLADHLAIDPRTVNDLARLIGASEDALGRLLAFLASLGVVSLDGGKYSLTPTGVLLQSHVPGSMRNLARIYGAEFARGWNGLPDSVLTGQPGFMTEIGEDLYRYLDAHPDRLEVFAGAMAGSVLFDEFASSGTFVPGDRVVDVGGGAGHLLAAVLKAVPDTRGILFERQLMAEYAQRHLRDAGVLAQCAIEIGDFFCTPIPVGDCYVLSRVLHDWSDDDCIKILRNLGRTMQSDAKLLVVERVMDDGLHKPSRTLAFDIHMLVTTGGRERSYADFERLFDSSDLAVRGRRSLPLGMSALEVRPT